MKKFVVAFVELKWYLSDLENSENVAESFSVFNAKDLIITYQTGDFIRELTAKNKSLPNIVDLESLDKQMSQEGKDLRGYNKWQLLERLRHYKLIDNEFCLTLSNIRAFLAHIASFYSLLLTKDANEIERFSELELKINRIIFQTQKRGIGINSSLALQMCLKLEHEIYDIKNVLQLKYKIFDPENNEAQNEYLKSKKYKVIKSLLYSFEIRKGSDAVCNLIYNLLRNKRDLDSLLFLLAHWGGAHRTHPSYLGFGTITSRIILRQPALQNLRRGNRGIIVPDLGWALLYIDYSQFEAGVLASLSNDDLLIKLYNTDIYSDIANAVLDDESKREDAKIIFYRYMYGDESLPSKANFYFKKFSGLQKFKDLIQVNVLKDNKIGTQFGNYRKYYQTDSSWCLSHTVQATASYIFKKALLRTFTEVKLARLLIPMHDGAVYQVPAHLWEMVSKKVEAVYIHEFKNVCPQINPAVKLLNHF